ncbi:M48 family metalloprotease [Halocatena halophila]|uniref:M48 family metalloprotease n=1 Tax=Halocatena halophila TaxID=2814576 RepID=UPI002ED1FCD9
MYWSLDNELRRRMALTLLGLLALTLAFAAGITGVLAWTIGWLEGLFDVSIAYETQLLLGGIITVLAAVAVFYRALKTDAVDTFGAREIDPHTEPQLHATVARLSQLADVPMPGVYRSYRDRPLAVTTGLTTDETKLVVSTGLLESLDQSELEAVIAHEIAHIKNRDAAVMTLVELPLSSARALGRSFQYQTGHLQLLAIGVASYCYWALGRLLVASLARSREIAADRGASALIGDPASVASALRTLDGTVPKAPDRDAREVALASMSIVPDGDDDPGPALTYSGGRPAFWSIRRQVRRPLRWLNVRYVHPALKTHPETTERIERLQTIERDA